MDPNSYFCPHCKISSFLKGDDSFSFRKLLDFDDHEETGRLLVISVKKCANPECGKITLYVYLRLALRNITGSIIDGMLIKEWQFLNDSSGAPLPNYIPEAVVEDYKEAYAIKNLSPKASATLARRCLQGMIRDFWGVDGKKNLYQEIEAIKEEVNPSVWKAIDAVRKVGNIGAHMEKDINVIIDVEVGEAEKLIALIEMLIKEWYIADHDRNEMLKAIEEMGQKKEQAKKPAVEAPNAIPLSE